MKTQETFYDLLKIPSTASVAEVVNAYHAARNAFGKDSVAAYSLFSEQETEQLLKQLEEAYQTLSNLDRRREYDRLIGMPTKATAPPAHAPETPPAPSVAPPPSREKPGADTALEINGAWIRAQREKNSMSLEDVARLTKIPSSAIKAIEADDLAHLPTRVYLQGFVNNLMKVYRLDVRTTKIYLQNIDRLLSTRQVG